MSLRKGQKCIMFAMRTFALILLIAILLPASATAATAPYKMTRLFYYREGKTAKKDFIAHAASIDILAPQTYRLKADGTLSGTLDPEIITLAKQKKVKLMPLITNEAFSDTSFHAMFNDTALQGIALSALITEAKDHGYYGWQFDFEQMDVMYKDQFSAFIARMAQGLHAAGLKVSVAVIAKVSDNPTDYKNTLWQDLIGVYDYDALAASTDFVSIMSYDDPESLGPPVELPWLYRVLGYSLAHIPANKLSLGLALYYWARDDATGKIMGIGGNEAMDDIIARRTESYTFDPTNMIPVMHYAANSTTYSLYYENSRSMREKVALIKGTKLYGFSAWALGLEVPSVWKVF